MLILALSLFHLVNSAPLSCPSVTTYDPTIGVCYWFSQTTMDFSSAESTCVQKGGHLSSISGAGQNSFLGDSARQANIANSMWIGLTSAESNKADWEWVDGSPVTYMNWRGQVTPTASPTNSCATMDSDFFWKCNSCSQSFPFACTLPISDGRTTRPPMTTTFPSGQCEDGWHYFNGYCYLISHETVNHDEAVAMCSNHSSQLASVHSEEENKFIHDLFERKITFESFCAGWIGFHKVNRTTYAWDDGSAWDYENWQDSYPKPEREYTQGKMLFSNGNQGCSDDIYHSGKWENGDYEASAVACKKAAQSLPKY